MSFPTKWSTEKIESIQLSGLLSLSRISLTHLSIPVPELCHPFLGQEIHYEPAIEKALSDLVGNLQVRENLYLYQGLQQSLEDVMV